MTEAAAKLRIFGICGRSGQGKTTLIEALLPWFRARGHWSQSEVTLHMVKKVERMVLRVDQRKT